MIGASNQFISHPFEFRTSSATQGTAHSVRTYPNGVYQIKAFVNCHKPSTNDAGGWEISGTFKNISGTLSLIGALDVIANKDQSGLDATVSVSGGLMTLRVTGLSSSAIVWSGEMALKRLELNN